MEGATDHANEADAQLLRETARRQAQAFEQLMDRHQDRLFRLAILMVGNSADAEDVLQETLVGIFRSAGKFAGRSTVRTWMTGILSLQVARWWRDKKRRRMRSVEGQAIELPSPGHASQDVERRIDLLAAMEHLSIEHRQVVALREFEGMSYAQIADLVGVPMGTVESRLSRARGELRTALKDYLP